MGVLEPISGRFSGNRSLDKIQYLTRAALPMHEALRLSFDPPVDLPSPTLFWGYGELSSRLFYPWNQSLLLSE